MGCWFGFHVGLPFEIVGVTGARSDRFCFDFNMNWNKCAGEGIWEHSNPSAGGLRVIQKAAALRRQDTANRGFSGMEAWRVVSKNPWTGRSMHCHWTRYPACSNKASGRELQLECSGGDLELLRGPEAARRMCTMQLNSGYTSPSSFLQHHRRVLAFWGFAYSTKGRVSPVVYGCAKN